jgi:hypothetical protein
VHTDLYEFLREAEMDYQVRRIPASIPLGNGEHAIIPGQYHVAAYRPEAGVERILSPHTVSAQTGCISPMDIADELESLWRDSRFEPDACYQTRGGSMDTIAFRIDPDFAVLTADPSSSFKHYFGVFSPYGGGKIIAGAFSHRMVCENTFAAGFSEARDMSVTHRKAREVSDDVMRERVNNVARFVDDARQHIDTLEQRIRHWLGISVSIEQANNFFLCLCDIPKDTKADDIAGHKRTKFDTLVSEFNQPDRGTYGRTAYDLYNAVTAYLSSPAVQNPKSTVSGLARVTRNITVGGSGRTFLRKAVGLLAKLG